MITCEKNECHRRVTWVLHKQHECDTNETQATRVLHKRYECDASATRVENVVTTQVKIYFHTPTLAIIRQMKNYKERDYFILRTRKATLPCQNAFEKCIIKTELCNGKVYQKVIHYIVAANARACSRIATHSNTASFSIKITFYVELTTQYRCQ